MAGAGQGRVRSDLHRPADLLQLQTHGRRVRCAARPCAAAGHGHGPARTRWGAVLLQQLPPLQAGPGTGGEVPGRGYLRPDPGQGLPAQPADTPQLADYPPAVTAHPRLCTSTRPGCECGLGRFAPRAVLLHPSRDFPAPKPGFSPNRRGTRPGSAAVGYVGGAAAVDVGEDQVQGFAAAAGGGVVDDGGDGPALAVVVAGDAGDGADVAQGAGLD